MSRERNDEICRLYVVEEWSMRRIADHYGLSNTGVQTILRKCSVQARARGRQPKKYAAAFEVTE